MTQSKTASPQWRSSIRKSVRRRRISGPPVLMERALREEMVDWTQMHLLTPGLTALFERAGVTDRGMMARTMVQWFYYDKYSCE